MLCSKEFTYREIRELAFFFCSRIPRGGKNYSHISFFRADIQSQFSKIKLASFILLMNLWGGGL